eukprot:6616518-Pyramimonas_sp.AAC.1
MCIRDRPTRTATKVSLRVPNEPGRRPKTTPPAAYRAPRAQADVPVSALAAPGSLASDWLAAR